jgi:hypothetical protein
MHHHGKKTKLSVGRIEQYSQACMIITIIIITQIYILPRFHRKMLTCSLQVKNRYITWKVDCLKYALDISLKVPI